MTLAEKRAGHRTANITHQPSASREYPWNVGLYDPNGYVESIGAKNITEALRIADQWVRYDLDMFADPV